MAFPNITKRLASSAIILAIFFFVVFNPSVYLFLILIEALALVALYEFYTLVEKKQIAVNKRIGLAFGAALPLFFYFPGESVLIGFCILSLFLISLKNRAEGTSSIVNVSVTLLGILYVSWFLSFAMKIRCLPHGSAWIVYLVLITKMGDAGAYFIGSKFGKTKLSEVISPNKTVEGAVAGLLTAILCSVLSKAYLPHVPIGNLFVLGFVLGALAQVGDLVESLIKRDVGAKDSGSVPGLGGVLDVLDSLLFTSPFLYYYITAVLGG